MLIYKTTPKWLWRVVSRGTWDSKNDMVVNSLVFPFFPISQIWRWEASKPKTLMDIDQKQIYKRKRTQEKQASLWTKSQERDFLGGYIKELQNSRQIKGKPGAAALSEEWRLPPSPGYNEADPWTRLKGWCSYYSILCNKPPKIYYIKVATILFYLVILCLRCSSWAQLSDSPASADVDGGHLAFGWWLVCRIWDSSCIVLSSLGVAGRLDSSGPLSSYWASACKLYSRVFRQ